MRHDKLEVKSKGEGCTFDGMPRLVGKGGRAELSIKYCPHAFGLADTLADYLSKTQADRIELHIYDSPGWDMKPEVFEVIFGKFEGLDMTIRNSVQPGFLESCPKAKEKFFAKKLDVVEFPSERLFPDPGCRPRAGEEKKFVINTDVLPFRKTELLKMLKRCGFPIYWTEEKLSQPSASAHTLKW